MSNEQEPAVTAPSKVCPHCGAQAQTLGKKCPNCGKGYKKRTGLKIFTGLAVLGLLGIGGCTALVVGGANEAVNEIEEERLESAISRAQFRQLELGMTERQVLKTVGKPPRDRQDLESAGIIDDEPRKSSCIYYNRADGEFLDSYQLCFDDGHLRSKNAW